MQRCLNLIDSLRGALACALLLSAVPAGAAVVFTVNSNSDEIDDDTSDGICHTKDGTCTLRAAVMQANKASGIGATIMLPAGNYVLVLPALGGGDEDGDLNLTMPASGNPVIGIVGAGAASTIVDANQIDRVFAIDAGRTVSMSGITVQNGYAGPDGRGGGIFNAGTLFLDHVTLTGNQAGNDGAGVCNNGTLTVQHSSFTHNVTNSFGGGIANSSTLSLQDSTLAINTAEAGGGLYNGGNLAMSGTTISFNTAPYSIGIGGGIFNIYGMTIVNSTIASNTADTNGGGIFNQGTNLAPVNLYNTTIAYNEADSDQNNDGSGGGIYVDSFFGGVLNIYNNVLAGNFNAAFTDDCYGPVSTHARNLFGNTSQCTITQISGGYALLNPQDSIGPLQNNGGPTQTVALLAGSNAIDGTIAGVCHDNYGFDILTDQRGFARSDGLCDVGAYEYNEIFSNSFEAGP